MVLEKILLQQFRVEAVDIWDIRLQKCRDLENRVRGASRSWKCHHV